MGCVYLLTCKVSGKQYVGLTSRTLDVRFKEHLNDAGRGRGGALHRAIRKYGADCFKLETLVVSGDRDELSDFEATAVELFNTRAPHGYNLTGGGEAPCGEQHPRFGKTHSEETRRKIRATLHTPEVVAKVSGVNHHLYGKKMSPEWLAKMSECRLGSVKMHCPVSGVEVSPRADEVALFEELGYIKGRPQRSTEWGRKIGDSRVGIHASADTKAKMSATRIALADKRVGPLRGAINNLVQAGMTREDIEGVLFLIPGRVKAVRRKRGRPKNLGHKPVTIDGEATPVL